MNYCGITKCDQLNGDGFRVVLWVSGCSHHCKNCQNPETWNPEAGSKFDENAKNELFRELEKDWCSGITFSGGDPLFEGNRREVIDLSSEIKERFPNKTIWLYTGYTLKEINEESSMSEILPLLDVLIDGEFMEELADPSLHWRGSSNQKIWRKSCNGELKEERKI